MKIIKISQLVYIKNPSKEKNLINYNILIKISLCIKINKLNKYDKANLRNY